MQSMPLTNNYSLAILAFMGLQSAAMGRSTQICVRIPDDLLAGIDQIAQELAKRGLASGRPDVLRYLAANALPVVREQLGITAPPATPGKRGKKA